MLALKYALPIPFWPAQTFMTHGVQTHLTHNLFQLALNNLSILFPIMHLHIARLAEPPLYE